MSQIGRDNKEFLVAGNHLKMPNQETSSSFASLRKKILAEKTGKDYWRSVEEFTDAPEFREYVDREFPDQAEGWDDKLNRRNFIKVMGASLALAGLSGCVIQPSEKIVPYVNSVEGLMPGVPLFYATSMVMGGIATGVLAKSFDGRPVKIEGNPEHPGSLGGSCIYSQASLLDMYDPDRSQVVMQRGTPNSWQGFVEAVRTSVEENGKDGGAGLRYLTPTITSPSMQAQFARILTEMPNAKWVQYEPINNDNAMAGAKLAFGSPAHPVYRIDKATRILSIDADIFSGPNSRYTHDFATGRSVSEEDKEMNRLYSIETTLSLVGAKADHRLAAKPSQVYEIVKAVAKAVGVSGAESTYTENSEWIAAMAKDLSENRGKSLVFVGDNQPPEVHAAAYAINSILGNIGETIIFTDPLSVNSERSQLDQLKELVADIDAGRVKTLVILGGNPAYNTPSDLKINLERLEGKVPLRLHVGTHYDETAEICHWHVPEKHYLESWGDARAYDGTVSLIQPLIEPLYSGKSATEVLQLFARDNFDKSDRDIVREYWQGRGISAAPAAPAATPSAVNGNSNGNSAAAAAPTPAPAASSSFEDSWRKALHDGVIANSALPAKPVTVNTAFFSQPATTLAGSGGLEVSILPDPSVYDGRFTNNGWMQELPNPLTKITWENVALISPATAKELGISGNDPRRYPAANAASHSLIPTETAGLILWT